MFIELTEYGGERPSLWNTRFIECVLRPEDGKGSTIVFAGGAYIVIETYEEVKAMIIAAKGI